MQRSIKAIIIDDEKSSVIALTGMLQTFCPGVIISGSAQNLEEAVALINAEQPDVVFLDIELPPEDFGFDLLKMLPEVNFQIVLITAYEEYAIQAINEIKPAGYLTKPFRVKALTKIMAGLSFPEPSSTFSKPGKQKGIIVNDRRKGSIVIKHSDILYCKADRNTTDIYYIQNDKLKRVISSNSLKSIYTKLDEKYFCRTHHAYVVNMRHIESYKKTGRNGLILMKYDCRAEISVLKMESFEKKFKEFLV